MTRLEANPEFDGDTSRESLRVQFAALRRMTVAQKLAMMDGLTQLVRSMAIEGLRRRNPDASDAEIEGLFSELVLGKELAAQVSEHRRSRSTSRTP